MRKREVRQKQRLKLSRKETPLKLRKLRNEGWQLTNASPALEKALSSNRVLLETVWSLCSVYLARGPSHLTAAENMHMQVINRLRTMTAIVDDCQQREESKVRPFLCSSLTLSLKLKHVQLTAGSSLEASHCMANALQYGHQDRQNIVNINLIKSVLLLKNFSLLIVSSLSEPHRMRPRENWLAAIFDRPRRMLKTWSSQIYTFALTALPIVHATLSRCCRTSKHVSSPLPTHARVRLGAEQAWGTRHS